MIDLRNQLAEQLSKPGTSWSMGSYGAVAEFFQDSGESLEGDDSDNLTRITPRGGIRIELQEEVGVCSYANSSKHGSAQQHIALCLPESLSRMSVNKVLTELGPDFSALGENNHDATLFDLGVSSMGNGCYQLDFCIRTDDADLIAFLRDHCGSSIFEDGSPVFPKLLEAQPHRVAITRLGRIEVYQAIGGEHTDDQTPEGPHTHLLPDLLSLNLTHSDDVPVKESWVPCAFLYLNNPVLSEPGEAHR